MEQSQNPIQESVSDIDSISTPSINSHKVVIVSVIILSLLTLSTFLYLQNQKLQKKVIDQQVSPIIQISLPALKTVSLTTVPTDEMANWKTYESKQYKFQFNYPQNFDLVQKEDPGEVIAIVLDLGKNIRITVRDPKIPKEEILRNWHGYEEVSLKYVKGYREESTSSAIGGNPPHLKIVQYLFDTPKFNVFIAFGEINEGDFSEYQTVFNQILSTFKFIDDTR